VKAITAFFAKTPPSTTFIVVVSRLDIPGHPSEEYFVETFNYNNPEERTTYVATQEGAEVAQHTNVGALLTMLLEA
jgi:hypothetical protein